MKQDPYAMQVHESEARCRTFLRGQTVAQFAGHTTGHSPDYAVQDWTGQLRPLNGRLGNARGFWVVFSGPDFRRITVNAGLGNERTVAR